MTIDSASHLRPELEQLPRAIAQLPVHRGYPVPWFVEWVSDGKPVAIGEGTPDFRIMSSERFSRVLRVPRCWICGERLGAWRSFVIGPMCAVNRTSAEPPSHRECAEWSARNCPFLSRPHMRRREAGLPLDAAEGAGVMIARNPGVTLVWTARNSKPKSDRRGGVLFDIGDPRHVSWWREGRPALREEILESIESGLPTLREMAQQGGPAALRELQRCVDRALVLLPAA